MTRVVASAGFDDLAAGGNAGCLRGLLVVDGHPVLCRLANLLGFKNASLILCRPRLDPHATGGLHELLILLHPLWLEKSGSPGFFGLHLDHQAAVVARSDLPAFFGPIITGEQRQLKFVVRLRVLPGQREPALPASALRHPSQP